MSQVPQRTSGLGAAHVIPIPRAPKAPQVVLYDQYNNAATTASLSATFTDFPTFSSDLADDFVVPGGQTWNVQSIDADGVVLQWRRTCHQLECLHLRQQRRPSRHASLQHGSTSPSHRLARHSR